jgi:Tfp pilus assembly protein PilF
MAACGLVLVLLLASCSHPALRRSPAETSMTGALALEQRAYTAVERGDYLTGIQILEEVLRQDRSNAKAMYVLGYVYGQLGEIENEINYYEAAIEAGYHSDQAFHNLGKAYLGSDLTALAIQSFEKGLILNPDNADNHFGLGMAYQKVFEYDKAEREILKAIELEPDVPEFREYLGRFYEDAGELEKAEEQFRRILEIDPHYEGAREYMEEIERKRRLRDNR